MSGKRKSFVKSLARGLGVLQAFSTEETHLTLTQLAERVELGIPVVQRYTNTLVQLGSKTPAYCSAMGKVLLTSLEDSELIKTIKSMTFRRVTKFTITEPTMLWDNLMEVRKRGYSVCDRELSMDLYSLAVPVIDGEWKVVAAVNISLIAGEAQEEVLKRMLNCLISVSEEISKSLEYRGKYPFVGPY